MNAPRVHARWAGGGSHAAWLLKGNIITRLFSIDIETEAIGIFATSWDPLNTPLGGMRATI